MGSKVHDGMKDFKVLLCFSAKAETKREAARQFVKIIREGKQDVWAEVYKIIGEDELDESSMIVV